MLERFKLADCLEPQRLPPYYFIFLGNITKVFLLTYLFGPPKASKVLKSDCFSVMKAWGMVAFRLGLLGLLMLSAPNDIKDILDIFKEHVTSWEKVQCICIIVSSSPNSSNAFAMLGLAEIFSWRKVWQDLHDPNCNLRSQGFCEKIIASFLPPGMYKEVGIVGMAYYWFLLPYGAVCYFLIFTYGFVAIIVYCWAFIPFLILVYCAVNPALMKMFIALGARSKPERDGHEMVELQEPGGPDRKLHIVGQLLVYPRNPSSEEVEAAAMGAEAIGFGYDAQLESYNTLGTPKHGLQNYFPWFTFHPMFVQCAVIMVARLVCGHGYWVSFSTTLTERHIADYLTNALHKFTASMGMLQIFI